MIAANKKPVPSLSDRIAATLNDPARNASDLAALIGDVEPEVARLRLRVDEIRAAALNPRLTAEQVLDLRGAADDAEFEAQRIEHAAEVLATERDVLIEVERECARVARYAAAKARRDDAAARIKVEYPELAAALLELIGEVVASTADVVAANKDLPRDYELLEHPEDMARSTRRHDGARPGRDFWRIAEAVLPPLEPSALALWPRSRNGVGADCGLLRGSDLPKLSPYRDGNWPDDLAAKHALRELTEQKRRMNWGGAE